ncbi:hypothetical protein LOD99_16130 [Oopsacas minuta]|uniref:MACPF domain-containing protein n=1 Tax=Oopsacas minuta TaxID=111878 RepID=A0AAV7K655_9METZ|nr:hypothetical protein LOD99_16130 [Oopsacas minuta]
MAEQTADEATNLPRVNSQTNLQSSLIPGYTPPTMIFEGILTLPRTPIEAYKLSREVVHKSLEMVGKSLCAQRPANRAVFFLYGLSGAGKTSTLNHLFNGTESLQVSHNKSGIRDVIEYTATMQSEHWSADGLEISFIDAPGFNDTLGRHQDAINLANIELFINQHSQLGLQNFAKFAGLLYTYAIFYPNIVLITVDANDERLFGYDTDVGRMLRALGKKRMRIVDSKRPNVVFIMTHVCGIAKGYWENKLQSKAYCLQLLGRRYLKINAPVVYIENDFKVWDLPEAGEWTVLHNGERQPLNLFKKCIEVLQRNQDEVGIEATRLYYENSKNVPLKMTSRIQGSLYTELSDNKLSENSSYWLEKVNTPFKCLETTNVDLKITEFIKENKTKDNNMDLALYPLKFILQKNNLKEVKDISVLTLPEIESMLIPYRLSNLEKHVICQLFKPIPPKPEYITPALGCGLNIFEDKILKPVFDTSQVHQQADYNFLLPTGTLIFEYFNTEATCRGVKRFSEFAKEKLTYVGFRKYSNFAKFPLACGYNIIDPSYLPKKDCKISFRIEQTVYRVQLSPSSDYTLCKNFVKDVNLLPPRFDELDDDIVRAFSEFFMKYGNWAIVQSTLGGYIEGVMSVNRDKALREDYYTTIRKLVITHIGNTINGAKFIETLQKSETLVEEMQIYENIIQSKLTWFGGDPRYHVTSLDQLSRKSWNAWTESLKINPIIIPNSFLPLPLHSILHSHENINAMSVQRAYEFLTDRITAPKSFNIKRLLGMSTIPRTREEASQDVKSDIKNDSCFPASSKVLLSTGRIVCMRDLQIGDKMLSVDSQGRSCFSSLYLWGHLDPARKTEYLCIRYKEGELKVSENHLVFVEKEGIGEPIPAGRVCPGDMLQFVCVAATDVVSSVEVLSVSYVRDEGVYSPFTLNSCIVVDGILCSVFAVPPGVVRDITQVHRIGHILFAPLRLTYKSNLCRSISYPMNTVENTHVYCSALKIGYLAMKPIEMLIFGKTLTEKL